MDQAIRNKLRNVVTQCRKLLEDAVSQVLQGQFGIYASGKRDEVHIEDDVRMMHLGDEDRAYRKDILGHFEHIKAFGSKPKDALDQLIREIAFTHLNRLCAYKMMEARGLIREAVSRELRSQGFLFYLADHPEDEQRYNTGQQHVAYRHFLDWLGGTLSEEIGVLFNPNDPANRLYPPQRVLDEVLALINDEELAGIWSEDETIGWVYQYFTPKELRDQARKESAAPRNSYELAFRNQFFTPRYVVEFLTDNTLGRIWYEMRRGNTKLTDQCRYMVRRPNKIFLEENQTAPQDADEGTNDLSQEELLKQPVYIPYRPKKDPRDLKILDPACGSGHFLLYCFDLLQTIYEEAYDDPDLGPELHQDYPTPEDLQRAVPGLILSHNLHGIDIDIRATQIAALALWLRCQRSYQDIGLKKDRPKIKRSNIVCAEPMPGEMDMLKEFVADLQPRVLGQLVEVVFDKMKLAGEAGSLLKIEEDIRDVVSKAKDQWLSESNRATDQRGHELLFSRAEMERLSNKPSQQGLFDVSEITDEQFWDTAETQVLTSLQDYANRAADGRRLQRQLFADDTAHGFAFIDICQKKFDVVLMNPPFGLPTSSTYPMIVRDYHNAYADLAATFMSLVGRMCANDGVLAAITTRSFLQSSDLSAFRKEIFLPLISLVIDLGPGVMDEAWVEASMQILSRHPQPSTFLVVDRRLLQDAEKAIPVVFTPTSGKIGRVYTPSRSYFDAIPKSRIAYDAGTSLSQLITSRSRLKPERIIATTGLRTFDDERFYRLRWEIRSDDLGPQKTWCDIARNTDFSCFYSSYNTVVKWCGDGNELAEKNREVNGQTAQARQGSRYYFRSGLCFSRRSEPTFSVRVHPDGCAFSSNGGVILPKEGVSYLYLAGLLNSSPFRAAIRLLANKYSYTSGHVEVLEWRDPDMENFDTICDGANKAIDAKIALEKTRETDPYFHGFTELGKYDCIQSAVCEDREQRSRLVEQIMLAGRSIDDSVSRLYDLEFDGKELAEKYRSSVYDLARSEASQNIETSEWTADLISYFMGCILGRWDVCFATGGQKPSKVPDPLARIPVCSPGMLQGTDGLPLTETPGRYPLLIDWDGIPVDDPDHQDDIICRVRDVLELIWKDRADAIEKEACEILGVKQLRDYFRKPGKGGFWDDHVSRYSKSRRKAPIYWLLQSSKKNYALWLYYHRLDKDILFKALLNYVEPKIRLEESRLEPLRAQRAEAGTSGKGAKKLEKDIDRQEDFISELRDFEDKLRRVANLHLNPDLNDGVVLNIAPLRELVPWKEAKKYWDELLAGKYEWSSIGKQLREKGIVHGP